MNANRSLSDPTGAWINEQTSEGAVPSANSTPPIEAMDARSMGILRKERELAEREIQLLRREVEMMREMQRLNVVISAEAAKLLTRGRGNWHCCERHTGWTTMPQNY